VAVAQVPDEAAKRRCRVGIAQLVQRIGGQRMDIFGTTHLIGPSRAMVLGLSPALCHSTGAI
jgi:hypothetical protein